jgi:hypothetical protein
VITGVHGVIFTRDAETLRAFRMTAIRLPGGGELGLYEPRHPTPLAGA